SLPQAEQVRPTSTASRANSLPALRTHRDACSAFRARSRWICCARILAPRGYSLRAARAETRPTAWHEHDASATEEQQRRCADDELESLDFPGATGCLPAAGFPAAHPSASACRGTISGETPIRHHVFDLASVRIRAVPGLRCVRPADGGRDAFIGALCA